MKVLHEGEWCITVRCPVCRSTLQVELTDARLHQVPRTVAEDDLRYFVAITCIRCGEGIDLERIEMNPKWLAAARKVAEVALAEEERRTHAQIMGRREARGDY